MAEHVKLSSDQNTLLTLIDTFETDCLGPRYQALTPYVQQYRTGTSGSSQLQAGNDAGSFTMGTRVTSDFRQYTQTLQTKIRGLRTKMVELEHNAKVAFDVIGFADEDNTA
jgi:hypothetical protein